MLVSIRDSDVGNLDTAQAQKEQMGRKWAAVRCGQMYMMFVT